MNKFADWLMKKKDRKQNAVAEILGISPSTLHDILKKGQLPSLKLAYAIEDYTGGDVTVYDWFDYPKQEKSNIGKIIAKPKAKAIKK